MAASPPTFGDDDTLRAELPSIAEITLDAVFDTLERVEPSVRARELLGRAHRYRFVIGSRATTPPTNDQRKALRELVNELHEEILESMRSGKLAARGAARR